MSEPSTSDPDERVPCPDDMCTGVIGEGGRCGTCGRVVDGASLAQASAPSETTEAPEATKDAGAEPMRAESEESPAHDPDERVPCPDDMCTGVIGEDGRCGTCGRSADQTSG